MKSLATFSLFTLLLLSSPAHAWNGKVVKVLSGDTFIALKKDRQQTIKLYGLECPAPETSLGARARNLTRAKIKGKRVKINPITLDGQDRIIARVSINGQSLNAFVLRSGYGLVNRKKCSQPVCEEWIGFERYAHKQKNGVW
ncbi:MAG: thermonuclease family protein, partial [Desulfobulbaceae bacterium]|nr:thermonuclease family protein [Desulfobulbaceae bacterium]